MSGFDSFLWLRIVGVWSTLGFAAPLLPAANDGDQARTNLVGRRPPEVSLTLDVMTVIVGQPIMARSSAGPAGEVVSHGLEGRMLGGNWQNWKTWDDRGSVQQVAFRTLESAGLYELRAYAARADEPPALSHSIFVTVNAGAPTIMTQPASAIASTGENVAFTVVVTGAVPTYQWSKDGARIAGATNSTLTLARVQLAQAGSYRATVSNSAGAIASNPATLVVTAVSLSAAVVDAWRFPAGGGKQPVPLTSARVGDVVTLNSSQNLVAGAGWRHNLLVRRPAITAANAMPPEDGSGLNETEDVWNKDGWGRPHADINSYNAAITGEPAVDLGHREPFIHALAAGQAGSTRALDFVLDAPGTWLFRAEVVDGTGQQVALSPQASVTVAPPPLAGDVTNMTYPYGRSDRFVGVYWNAGQAHRLWTTWRAEHQSAYGATWAVNWKLMWQPSPYFRVGDGTWLNPDPITESPWQAFWSAHQVYAIVPDGLGGSTLTHDLTSQPFAEKAALRLMDVGVDFVTVDYTNQFLELSEAVGPAMANLAQAFQAVAARSQSNQKIKLCAIVPATVEGGDWAGNGGFVAGAIAKFNAKLTTLYNRYANNEATWFFLEDDNGVRKPLLLLWIGGDGAGEPDGKLAAGRLSQLKLSDGRLLTDVFTIRWVGAYMAANPRFAAGSSYTVTGPEGSTTGAYLKPKFWSYREHHPAGATLVTTAAPNPVVEAITVQPDASGRDRFGREWLENWPAGAGFHYETPANRISVPLAEYGRIWNRSLAVARALNPRILMTTWAEFGSENDEPRPEMSVTIMDNNKFGTHFGDAFKEAVRSFKYRAPECWLDAYTYAGEFRQFSAIPATGWQRVRLDEIVRLQGWVTPNVATTFPGGSVKVYVDDTYAGSATVGGAWNGATGWSYELSTNSIGLGRHVIKIVAEDGVGGMFQAGVQFQGEAPRNVLPILVVEANSDPSLTP